MAENSELVGDIEEAVDDFGMGELVEGLAEFCRDRARDDDPQSEDWARLAKIFEWVKGKVEDLGLD